MELQAVAWVTDYPIRDFDAKLSLRRQSQNYSSGVFPGQLVRIESEPSAMSFR